MKYIYELIGTFFLVLTIGLTIMHPVAPLYLAPLAIGTILSVMIYAGGHVSGGHYNPAVSFAVFLSNKLSMKDMLLYWLSQCVGALIAAFMTIYFKGDMSHSTLELETMKAFSAEFIFTFALCFVVLNVALAKGTKGNSFYGWAIGFTVMAGAYAVGPISGAMFNPAVAIATCLMNILQWSNIWIFFSANLLGGALAAFIFNATEQKEG